MSAVVVENAGTPRDPETGRFVRGEGDFEGAPAYADAPVTERELGPQDAAPARQGAGDDEPAQRHDQNEVIDEDTRIALQELDPGEVPSEHAPAFQLREIDEVEAAPAQVAAPTQVAPAVDQNALMLQMMQSMIELQTRQLQPPPVQAPAVPPAPSILERLKTDKEFQRQYAYDVSGGRLNPDIPEHFAMLYSNAYTQQQIEQQRTELSSQLQAMQQFQTQLIQAAQQQQALSASQAAVVGALKGYAISDDPQALSQITQQVAAYVQQGHDPAKAVAAVVGPMQKHLALKVAGQRTPVAGQTQRLRQPSPAQQSAMKTVATKGPATGKPSTGKGEKARDPNWFKAVLAKSEKHTNWE